MMNLPRNSALYAVAGGTVIAAWLHGVFAVLAGVAVTAWLYHRIDNG